MILNVVANFLSENEITPSIMLLIVTKKPIHVPKLQVNFADFLDVEGFGSNVVESPTQGK